MRLAILTSSAIAAMVLVLAPSAPVEACSCYGQFGYVVWPRDQAQDVPRDTPIAIERRNFDGPPAELAIVLEDDEGTRIALEETRVLPQIAPACAFAETVFLQPAEPLREGVTYTLRFEGPDADAGAGELGGSGATFTTGARMYEPPPAGLAVSYLHVRTQDACMGQGCEIAELVLTFDGPALAPYWLAIESNAPSQNANRAWLAPNAWSVEPARPDDVLQLSVELPSDDRCVRVEVYAIDGERVIDEERCAPDSCALYDLRLEDTCGAPLSANVDAVRLPKASCEDPYVIPQDMFGNALYPDGGVEDAGEPIEDASIDEGPGAAPDAGHGAEPPGTTARDAGSDAGSASVSANGCRCSMPGAVRSLGARELSAFGALLALLLARLRRR